MSNPVVTNSSSSLNGKTLLTKQGLAANQPRCIVSRSLSVQSITDGLVTPVPIVFDTAVVNIGAMFVIGTPDRITIIESGFYLVIGSIAYADNATGLRYCYLSVNATYDLPQTIVHAFAGDFNCLQSQTVYQFSATDFIQLQALQNSGGALDTSSVASPANELTYVNSLMVVKLF